MGTPEQFNPLHTDDNMDSLEKLSPITRLEQQQISDPSKMSSEDSTSSTPATPPRSPLLLLEAPPSESGKTKNTKERVKNHLKEEFKLSEVELPEGTDKECSYFDGAALNLPVGWLIEQRPRPCGKLDQFFYQPGTGKQFRSLKEVWKHIKQISDQPTVIEPENKVPYPWTQMKRKNKRKRGIQRQPQLQTQPEPDPELEPFDDNNPPDSVTWCLVDAENDVWLPQVANAEKYKQQWEKAFFGITANPNADPSEPSQVFSTSGSGDESEEADGETK